MRTRLLPLIIMGLATAFAGCRGKTADGRDFFAFSGEHLGLLADYIGGYRNATAASGGPVWGSTQVSVAANLIVTTPDNLEHWEGVSEFCQVGMNIPNFNSVEGVSPIMMTTSAQQATATWTGSVYEITGLVAGPAFLSSNDSLTLSHQGTATLSETIPAPPGLSDVNLHLGAPAGLATTFGGPDGTFDYIYTLIALDDGNADFDGVSCLFPHDEGTLTGGFRSHPLLDEDAIAWIQENSIATGSFGFGAYVNSREVDGFFDDPETPFSITAGRMVQFDPADLTP